MDKNYYELQRLKANYKILKNILDSPNLKNASDYSKNSPNSKELLLISCTGIQSNDNAQLIHLCNHKNIKLISS